MVKQLDEGLWPRSPIYGVKGEMKLLKLSQRPEGLDKSGGKLERQGVHWSSVAGLFLWVHTNQHEVIDRKVERHYGIN